MNIIDRSNSIITPLLMKDSEEPQNITNTSKATEIQQKQFIEMNNTIINSTLSHKTILEVLGKNNFEAAINILNKNKLSKDTLIRIANELSPTSEVTFSKSYGPRPLKYNEKIGMLIYNKLVHKKLYSEALVLAAFHGLVKQLQVLLITVRTELNDQAIQDSLIHACNFGHENIVKLLLTLKTINPNAQDNSAIRLAIIRGYSKIVELLLNDKRIEPSFLANSNVYKFAVEHNYSDIVQMLQKDVRIGLVSIIKTVIHNNSLDKDFPPQSETLLNYPGLFTQILLIAVKANHEIAVEALIKDKRVNPSSNRNAALELAHQLGRKNIVRLLLRDVRVRVMHDILILFKHVSQIERETEALEAKFIDLIIGKANFPPDHFNECIQICLDNPSFDASFQNNLSLALACKLRRTVVVKNLLKNERVIKAGNYDLALKNAKESGHEDIVKLFSVRAATFGGEIKKQ